MTTPGGTTLKSTKTSPAFPEVERLGFRRDLASRFASVAGPTVGMDRFTVGGEVQRLLHGDVAFFGPIPCRWFPEFEAVPLGVHRPAEPAVLRLFITSRDFNSGPTQLREL